MIDIPCIRDVPKLDLASKGFFDFLKINFTTKWTENKTENSSLFRFSLILILDGVNFFMLNVSYLCPLK